MCLTWFSTLPSLPSVVFSTYLYLVCLVLMRVKKLIISLLCVYVIKHTHYTVCVFQYGHSEAGGVEHVPPGWNYWVGLVRLKPLTFSATDLL